MPLEIPKIDRNSDTWENVFSRIDENFVLLKEYVESLGTTIHKEVLSVTNNQKVFYLSHKYSTRTNSLAVYRNGVRQWSPEDYTESSDNSFTFDEPCSAKESVVVLYNELYDLADKTNIGPTVDKIIKNMYPNILDDLSKSLIKSIIAEVRKALDNEGYVTDLINKKVVGDPIPSKLNTLSKVSQALGDNPNFAEDYTRSITDISNKVDNYRGINVWTSGTVYTSGTYVLSRQSDVRTLLGEHWGYICISNPNRQVSNNDPSSLTYSTSTCLAKDQSITWMKIDLSDGHRVGEIVPYGYKAPGYILADGSTIKSADYPRLAELLNTYNYDWRVGFNTNLSLAGILRFKDNTKQEIILPDFTYMHIKFTGPEWVGMKEKSRFPNIKGSIMMHTDRTSIKSADGVFRVKEVSGKIAPVGENSATNTAYTVVDFDASRLDPMFVDNINYIDVPHINMYPMMKF